MTEKHVAWVLYASVWLASALAPAGKLWAQSKSGIPEAIARAKPSIVAVGTYSPSRNPAFQFRGTGFVVGNGNQVATNAHVLPSILDSARQEVMVVAVGHGADVKIRAASTVATDETHDVALVKIVGSPLPAMALGDDEKVKEGEEYLITGFPLGSALGIYPITHRALLAGIVPVILPVPNAKALDPKVVRRMREDPFPVFQLDATIYPGNSGSPLYSAASAEVIAIINMVFVKETKEAAIKAPSGISYAIPVKYLKKLLIP